MHEQIKQTLYVRKIQPADFDFAVKSIDMREWRNSIRGISLITPPPGDHMLFSALQIPSM